MKKLVVVFASLFLMAGSTIFAQDQDRTKTQDRIHQEDHLRLQDGKLYLVNKGVQNQVKEQVKLSNGVVVNPDGTYQLQNQQKYQLRDGECMDMNGNRYLNQNRFNRREMMTNKQMEKMRTNNMNKNKAGTRRGGNPNN
jgi:hypothetical protein